MVSKAALSLLRCYSLNPKAPNPNATPLLRAVPVLFLEANCHLLFTNSRPRATMCAIHLLANPRARCASMLNAVHEHASTLLGQSLLTLAARPSETKQNTHATAKPSA